jgi:hypothetical protein
LEAVGPANCASREALRPQLKESENMAGPFTLSPLPYDENALEPVISARTIGFHYNKHHKTYVETLNKLVEGTRFADMTLEEVVRAISAGSTPWSRSWLRQARTSSAAAGRGSFRSTASSPSTRRRMRSIPCPKV